MTFKDNLPARTTLDTAYHIKPCFVCVTGTGYDELMLFFNRKKPTPARHAHTSCYCRAFPALVAALSASNLAKLRLTDLKFLTPVQREAVFAKIPVPVLP